MQLVDGDRSCRDPLASRQRGTRPTDRRLHAPAAAWIRLEPAHRQRPPLTMPVPDPTRLAAADMYGAAAQKTTSATPNATASHT